MWNPCSCWLPCHLETVMLQEMSIHRPDSCAHCPIAPINWTLGGTLSWGWQQHGKWWDPNFSASSSHACKLHFCSSITSTTHWLHIFNHLILHLLCILTTFTFTFRYIWDIKYLQYPRNINCPRTSGFYHFHLTHTQTISNGGLGEAAARVLIMVWRNEPWPPLSSSTLPGPFLSIRQAPLSPLRESNKKSISSFTFLM